MLQGTVPGPVLPLLYGANLFAFRKKDGGVRPIAVGVTLRRLTARIVSHRHKHLSELFSPVQLGFAVRGGAEAAVHAARFFLEEKSHLEAPTAFLKLDVKNAFNTLDRNALLQAVKEYMPQYYGYVWQNYSRPTHLLFGDHVIQSSTGLQQGDPIGPLVYCLATIAPHRELKSELVECFLDDDALGGNPDDVLSDFKQITIRLASVGLDMNVAKCELFVVGGTAEARTEITNQFVADFPSLSLPKADELSYLGAPLLDAAVPSSLEAIRRRVERLTSRLNLIPVHQGLYLLKNCLGPVKLLYVLRTSRSYRNPELLRNFDETIRRAYVDVMNTQVSSVAYRQMTLPTSSSGMGIRRTEELSLPAFLASAHSVQGLAAQIVNWNTASYVGTTVDLWAELAQAELPVPSMRKVQKSWDLPLVVVKRAELMAAVEDDPAGNARILAVSTQEASAWLYAPPSGALGYLLTDSEARIAGAQRLGAPVCATHTCVCGDVADDRGHHALVCALGKGRGNRHKKLNSVVQQALSSADIPSELEPTGLSLTDGSRPDGLTMVPLERGQCAAWDVTVVSSLAVSHIAATSTKAGGGAAEAEVHKFNRYRGLSSDYKFIPIGLKTMGPWGPEAKKFLYLIGRRIERVTGEKRSMEYLRQRISIEIQRYNAACVLQTAPLSENLDEIFAVIRPGKLSQQQ